MMIRFYRKLLMVLFEQHRIPDFWSKKFPLIGGYKQLKITSYLPTGRSLTLEQVVPHYSLAIADKI